ncbi:phage tail protein [Vibrio splendidus]
MANVSDKSILTAAGKALLAQLNAEEKALVIDKMIFANVPNRPEYPQPDDVVPADNVVHQAAVEQRGRLSEDSVIYSTTLASNEGPFEFNWTGAYCSEYGVLVTIDHHSLTPKTVDEPGVSGNTLVRSVVLEYKDIAEITNITVDASTWQYNANPRMKKMDSDVAQANIDQNGKDWFIEDGFLVTPQASAFSIKAGAGYVSGNRVALDFDRSIQVSNKPSFIYIDAHREGTPAGEQVTLFNFVVSAEEKDDYIDSSTGKDVPHFVCKIAQVLGDGSVSDCRPINSVEKNKRDSIKASACLRPVKDIVKGAPLLDRDFIDDQNNVWINPDIYSDGKLIEDGDAVSEFLNGVISTSNGKLVELVPLSSQVLTGESKTKTIRPAKPVFAFHFDGGYVNNFTNLIDKADSLGVPVCLGTIRNMTRDVVGGSLSPEHCTVGQIVDAHKRGHEIFNHGWHSGQNMKPGSNISDAVIEQWVNGSHDWLQELGIDAQVWVTSNGGGVMDQSPHLDPIYIPKILEQHAIALGRTSGITNDKNGYFGCSYGVETKLNIEGLTRANIEGVAISEIEKFIDFCIENNRVAVFHAHDSAKSSQVDVAKFEAVVHLIYAKGCQVVKSQEVFASFSNAFSQGVSTKSLGKQFAKRTSFVDEQLLPITSFENMNFERFNESISYGLKERKRLGEELHILWGNPTKVNAVVRYSQVIPRPFNTDDVTALCAQLEFIEVDGKSGSFGVEIRVDFYTSNDGSGTSALSFRKGARTGVSNAKTKLTVVGANGFCRDDINSCKIVYELAAKTMWSGVREFVLFNPVLNRGVVPATFRRAELETIWTGSVDSGRFTLDSNADDSSFVQIICGSLTSPDDARGSEIMEFNTIERRRIRVYGGDEIEYEIVVRFISPSELEVLSNTPVGDSSFGSFGVTEIRKRW